MDMFEEQDKMIKQVMFMEMVEMVEALCNAVKDAQGPEWANCPSHCWECSTIQAIQPYLDQCRAGTLNTIGQINMTFSLQNAAKTLVDILTSTSLDEDDPRIIRAQQMLEPKNRMAREDELADLFFAWDFAKTENLILPMPSHNQNWKRTCPYSEDTGLYEPAKVL